jgi:hypothetical protein
MPAPQPARVTMKNATAPMDAMATGQTLLASSIAPVPPTMVSNAPGPQPASGPRYVVTPAPVAPPAPQPMATLHSVPHNGPPPPSPYALPPQSPYAPPPSPYGPMGMVPHSYPQYPMMMQPEVPGTPGLAVASLVCGLFGLTPLWIGFVLCLLAITFGAVVLAKPGQRGRGLAIAGLVLGIVQLLPAACGL